MKQDKFEAFVSVLIAIVTVLGAVTAGMAARASSDAGDNDFEGMSAAINAQKAEIVNQVYAYEHYRAYTSYVRYLELGNLLYDPAADRQTAALNGVKQREAWGVASGLLSSFFEGRYINPDGRYDLIRELDEAWADDAQSNDLNSLPHFNEADHMRRRAAFLTANMITFAVAFWFLTLAQVSSSKSKVRYFWVFLGCVLGLGGILGILIGRFLV